MIQFFLCLFGRHHRDRRRVIHDGTHFRSCCVRCGIDMRRTESGWIVEPLPGKRPSGHQMAASHSGKK